MCHHILANSKVKTIRFLWKNPFDIFCFHKIVWCNPLETFSRDLRQLPTIEEVTVDDFSKRRVQCKYWQMWKHANYLSLYRLLCPCHAQERNTFKMVHFEISMYSNTYQERQDLLNHVQGNTGGGTFFKAVGSTNASQKNYLTCMWFELATVTSQALKYDAINFCQHV